ncbi:MAG TPA: hypothetical protein VFK05_35945 [Polyangiaceae bacterium]|nr:hypothetical protein [Polyangiaceae bacterium]
MKMGFVVIALGAWLTLGCSSKPSKSDVCGKCSSDAKTACELLYDACKDDDDCLNKLEDAKLCG